MFFNVRTMVWVVFSGKTTACKEEMKRGSHVLTQFMIFLINTFWRDLSEGIWMGEGRGTGSLSSRQTELETSWPGGKYPECSFQWWLPPEEGTVGDRGLGSPMSRGKQAWKGLSLDEFNFQYNKKMLLTAGGLHLGRAGQPYCCLVLSEGSSSISELS